MAFVIVGDGGWWTTSSDGVTWELTATNTDSLSPLSSFWLDFTDIEYNDGVFMAVTDYWWDNSDVATYLVRILRSTDDGQTFEIMHEYDALDVEEIKGVAYGDGLWVAVGGTGNWPGAVFTSSDGGDTWSQVQHERMLYSVAYNNGVWMAGGSEGYIYTSPDASTWTSQGQVAASSFENIDDIAYFNSRWVIATSWGNIFTSDDDGASWTLQLTDPPGSWLASVVKIGEKLVACGGDGYIYTSTDSESWTPIQIPTNTLAGVTGDGLDDIAGKDGVWAVAGAAGNIYITEDEGSTWSFADTDGGHWTGIAVTSSSVVTTTPTLRLKQLVR